MGRSERNYTEGYKSTNIELFNSGKTYSELSNEYGLPKTTIRQWVNNSERKKDGTEANIVELQL